MYKMCTIYDSKGEAYLRPFIAQSSAAAIRAFGDDVNSGSKESGAAQHPEDYTLFELGTWDEFTGSFNAYEAKKALINGLDCLKSKQ